MTLDPVICPKKMLKKQNQVALRYFTPVMASLIVTLELLSWVFYLKLASTSSALQFL